MHDQRRPLAEPVAFVWPWLLVRLLLQRPPPVTHPTAASIASTESHVRPMRNFYRVIALAFHHRFTVAATLLCSFAVAVLWGGNITAIYPVVDVIMLRR